MTVDPRADSGTDDLDHGGREQQIDGSAGHAILLTTRNQANMDTINYLTRIEFGPGALAKLPPMKKQDPEVGPG